MSDDTLHSGDHVTWSTHGTTTSGTVTRKLTKRTKAAGRTVAASAEEPQYEVRSERSGRTAVHKPGSLHRS